MNKIILVLLFFITFTCKSMEGPTQESTFKQYFHNFKEIFFQRNNLERPSYDWNEERDLLNALSRDLLNLPQEDIKSILSELNDLYLEWYQVSNISELIKFYVKLFQNIECKACIYQVYENLFIDIYTYRINNNEKFCNKYLRESYIKQFMEFNDTVNGDNVLYDYPELILNRCRLVLTKANNSLLIKPFLRYLLNNDLRFHTLPFYSELTGICLACLDQKKAQEVVSAWDLVVGRYEERFDMMSKIVQKYEDLTKRTLARNQQKFIKTLWYAKAQPKNNDILNFNSTSDFADLDSDSDDSDSNDLDYGSSDSYVSHEQRDAQDISFSFATNNASSSFSTAEQFQNFNSDLWSKISKKYKRNYSLFGAGGLAVLGVGAYAAGQYVTPSLWDRYPYFKSCITIGSAFMTSFGLSYVINKVITKTFKQQNYKKNYHDFDTEEHILKNGNPTRTLLKATTIGACSFGVSYATRSYLPIGLRNDMNIGMALALGAGASFGHLLSK